MFVQRRKEESKRQIVEAVSAKLTELDELAEQNKQEVERLKTLRKGACNTCDVM
jgi:hypothetical protein